MPVRGDSPESGFPAVDAGQRLAIWPVGGAAPPDARRGGVERYAAWLRDALAARGRLDPLGRPYAVRAALGGPAVRTGDGCRAAWVEAEGRSARRWSRHVQVERAAVQGAQVVVATSPMVAAELARHYGGPPATVVLNPLLNLGASVAASAPVSADLTADATCSGRIVLVGHGFRRKGVDLLIELLAREPRWAADVVGRDAHPLRWRARAWRAGLGDRLRWLGAREAAACIRGARLLLHPARYEPYGNVVAEAVAAAVPAVVSDRTGAACLLAPEHVWAVASGLDGLHRVVSDALANPQPPRLHPPSADAHLAALDRALFG